MPRTQTQNAHAERAQKAMKLAKALFLADGGHWGRERDEFDKWLDAAIETIANAHQAAQEI